MIAELWPARSPLFERRGPQDAWKLLNVNMTCRILENTGHEFLAPMAVVTDWLRTEVAPASKPEGKVEPLQP